VDRAQMEEQEFKRSISPLFSEQEGRFWTWREVMQRFGTEAMEGGFTPSVWRQIAFAKILKILQEQKPDIILLDGLRVLHQSQDLLKWEEAFKGIPHPQYALSPEVLAALPPIEILTLGVKNVTLPESTDPHPTEKDMVDHWQEMFANELRHEGKDTPKYQESVAALLGL